MRKNILGISLLLAALFCGCQATPEEEIVVGKNNGELESAIQVEAETQVGDVLFETYQESFVGGDSRVTVEIDAEITNFPNTTPVLRVQPRDIISEEVQQWAEALFEGNTAYEPTTEMSKSEITEQILEIRQLLGDEERLWSNALTQEDYDYTVAYWEEQLAFYEEQYNSAPETVVRQETDWVFQPGGYYDFQSELYEDDSDWENEIRTRKQLIVETEIDGYTVQISATNRSEDDYEIHNFWYIAAEELYDVGAVSDTEEEAIAIAETTVLRAGLDDWSVYSCTEVTQGEEGRAYYDIILSRNYHGIEMTPLPQLSAIGTEFAATCYYESLELYVSGGRVCFVSWMQPMDIGTIENENVQLLSFEEIMGYCQNMMQTTYLSSTIELGFPSESAAESATYTVNIDRITCGLVRVQVPDTDCEFYMMPAWNFYGRINTNVSGVYFAAEGNIEAPLLSLNAVDGSNIDVSVGY